MNFDRQLDNIAKVEIKVSHELDRARWNEESSKVYTEFVLNTS